MTNRLTFLSLGFLTLSFINQTIYGSEVDFFIGETVNSTPLKSKLIFKEEVLLPDIQRVKLISNFFDEIDKEEIDKASIPDISPHSFAQIKFKSEKSDNLTLAEFSELRNQSIEERKRIKVGCFDAYNKNFVNKNFSNIKFDMILDDGPHTLESMQKCVKLYSPLL